MKHTPIYILAIGRNADIMEVMNRLINAHENWSGTAVTSDKEALDIVHNRKCDLVLLCAGITEEEELAWKERMAGLDPSVVVLRHYGGGSGLLENEILSVLK